MIRTIYRGYDITGQQIITETGRWDWRVFNPENPGELIGLFDNEEAAQKYVDERKRQMAQGR